MQEEPQEEGPWPETSVDSVWAGEAGLSGRPRLRKPALVFIPTAATSPVLALLWLHPGCLTSCPTLELLCPQTSNTVMSHL